MTATLDLGAYFARIGYVGARPAPTLDTLRILQLQHSQAIAFENLNPLLRWPVSLEIGALQQKIVREGRGGWCFEQNLLFSHVLQELGFKITWLAARVLWNVPEGTVTTRSHMLVRVDLAEGSFIADVGFGVMTPTAPLRLEPGLEQQTPHERFRLIPADEDYVMQVEIGGAWKTLYRFGLYRQFLADYQMSNWYLCNHPDSFFLKDLMAARPMPDRRYSIRNNELTVHHLDGRTERYLMTSGAELRAALENLLGLSVPTGEQVDALLERLIRQTVEPLGSQTRAVARI